MKTPIKISIVFGAYNEETRVGASLELLKKYIDSKRGLLEIEVMAVEDCSTDKTIEVLKKYSFVKVLRNLPNRGKGYSIRRGVSQARGDWIFTADADFSTPITELDKYLKYINEYDCILGSRNMEGAQVKRSAKRVIAGKIASFLINFFLGLYIKDTQCAFKFFNRKCVPLFSATTIDRWGFDFEFLFFLRRNKIRIKEIPVIWNDTEYRTVKLSAYFTTLRELLYVWWNSRILRKYPHL